LRRKVCKDRISLAWMALRLLKMPQFLKPDLVTRALFSWSWSLLRKWVGVRARVHAKVVREVMM
jgi:hypothetical protein